MVNVAHTIAVASSKLLVKPEIKRPEDLRGKKIATEMVNFTKRWFAERDIVSIMVQLLEALHQVVGGAAPLGRDAQGLGAVEGAAHALAARRRFT